MPQLLFGDQLQGSGEMFLVVFLVVMFGAMVVLSYFMGKRSWRASGPKHPRATPPPAAEDTALLTIVRSWNPVGGDSAFRVIMDDQEIAMLVPGRTRTARVTAGPHQLHIEARGRQVSDVLHLELDPGQEVQLRCVTGVVPRRRGRPTSRVRLVADGSDARGMPSTPPRRLRS